MSATNASEKSGPIQLYAVIPETIGSTRFATIPPLVLITNPRARYRSCTRSDPLERDHFERRTMRAASHDKRK
jgi:hypothetical protein